MCKLYNIKLWLILSLTITTILIVTIFMLPIFNHIENGFKKGIIDQNNYILNSISTKISFLINDLENKLTLLNKAFLNISGDNLDTIKNYVLNSKLIKSIYVVDSEKGNIEYTLTKGPTNKTFNPDLPGLIQKIKKNKTRSDLFTQSITNTKEMYIAVSHKTYTIIGFIDLDYMTTIMKELLKKPSQKLFLINSNNTIIKTSPTKLNLTKDIIGYLKKHKKEFWYNTSILKNTNIKIIMYQPFKYLLTPVKNLYYYLIGICLITSIIITIFIIVFLNKLIKPLNKLLDCTNKVAKGDYEIKLNIKSFYEYRKLASNFKCMVKAIKQRETELRNMDKNLEQLLNSMSDSVYILDKQWKYVMINNIAKRIIDPSKHQETDMIGKKITEFLPNFEKTKFFKVYKKVMESGISDKIIDNYSENPDAKNEWYEVKVYSVHNGIMCISSNITQRVLDQIKLKEREERLRAMFNGSPISITHFDYEGNIIELNDSTIKLIGITKIDKLKKEFNIIDYFKKENDNDIIKKMKNGEYLRYERVIDFEEKKKDYDYGITMTGKIYLNISISPIYKNGNNGTEKEIAGYLAQAYDISEQKQMEEELRRSKAKYEAIIEDQTEFICRFLPDGHLSFTNEAFCRYYTKVLLDFSQKCHSKNITFLKIPNFVESMLLQLHTHHKHSLHFTDGLLPTMFKTSITN